jgi:flagellar basal body-associated protein FliL
MRGKGFGVGIGAGLLLGLLIVGVSMGGAGSGAFFTNGSAASKTQISTPPTQSTATAAGQSNNSQGLPPQSATTASTTTSATTSNMTSAPANLYSVGGITFSNNGPSNLDSLPQQSPAANALILVPVLVAFALGAVLYRASRAKHENAETE